MECSLSQFYLKIFRFFNLLEDVLKVVAEVSKTLDPP